MSDFEKYVTEQFTLLHNEIKLLKQDSGKIMKDIKEIKSDIKDIKRCLPYPTDNLDIQNQLEGKKIESKHIA